MIVYIPEGAFDAKLILSTLKNSSSGSTSHASVPPAQTWSSASTQDPVATSVPSSWATNG